MKTLSDIHRYAHAIYDIASDQKEIEVIEKDFTNLKEVIDHSNDLQKFIKNPTFQYGVIDSVINELAKKLQFSKTFLNFLKVLNKNRRFFYVEKIIKIFFEYLAQKKGLLSATLKLSHPISDQEKKNIQDKLVSALNKKISVTYEVDQSLILGSVLKIGSTLIDTSIKNKLTSLMRV